VHVAAAFGLLYAVMAHKLLYSVTAMAWMYPCVTYACACLLTNDECE